MVTDDIGVIVAVGQEDGRAYVPIGDWQAARERIAELERCLGTIIQALIDARVATVGGPAA